MFSSNKMKMVSLLAVMAAPAFAAGDKIAKIDATVDLSAVQNEQAAGFWANLEVDLENAIAQRVTDRLASEEEAMPDEDGKIEGKQIIVDIREVELASAFERQLNMGDAVLVGQVNIKDDTDNSNFDAYELSVSLGSAKVILPEGGTLVLSPDMESTYQQLVDAFADNVVSRLN